MMNSVSESLTAPTASLMGDLKLTTEQKANTQSLEKAYHDAMVDQCRRHCEVKIKLAKLLGASPMDEKAVREVVAETGRIQMDCERLTMDHVIAIGQVLDPAQRKIFVKRFSEEIVKTCPTVFTEPVK